MLFPERTYRIDYTTVCEFRCQVNLVWEPGFGSPEPIALFYYLKKEEADLDKSNTQVPDMVASGGSS